MALLELRGLALDDVDGIHLEVTKGFRMPPRVRGTDYVVAAAAGRLVGNRIADGREILLEGYVVGATPEDWATNRTALMTACAEGEGIDPGTLTVNGPAYGLGTGVSASIEVRVVNIAEGPIAAYARQTFSIALESVSADGWLVT